MREPCCIHRRPQSQCGQHPAVKLPTRNWGDSVQDRLPGELVPKCQRRSADEEHAAGDDFGDRVSVEPKRLEQPRFDGRPDHRAGIQDRPCLRRKPGRTGQDRISHRFRQSRFATRNDFGDEERVAIGQLEELDRIEVRVGRQLRDRSLRKRTQRHSAHRGMGYKLAGNSPERVLRTCLIVPIGDDDEGRDIRDPPAEISEQIERCFVRPVGIFDHNYRWRGIPELSENRAEELGLWR
jgi:hypothetical protein